MIVIRRIGCYQLNSFFRSSSFSFINSAFDHLVFKSRLRRAGMQFSFINSLFDYFFGNSIFIHKLIIRASTNSPGIHARGDATIFFNFGWPYHRLGDCTDCFNCGAYLNTTRGELWLIIIIVNCDEMCGYPSIGENWGNWNLKCYFKYGRYTSSATSEYLWAKISRDPIHIPVRSKSNIF